ncbi:uncharacterized protein TNCV_2592101 [Trichonephila clavipes]|nr:uncharacterized protein TNCV_2592101 [Trichonephila clavipes]
MPFWSQRFPKRISLEGAIKHRHTFDDGLPICATEVDGLQICATEVDETPPREDDRFGMMAKVVVFGTEGSSPVPLKTRRVGQRCTLNLSRAETSSRWCGVVVRRGGASSGVVHVT